MQIVNAPADGICVQNRSSPLISLNGLRLAQQMAIYACLAKLTSASFNLRHTTFFQLHESFVLFSQLITWPRGYILFPCSTQLSRNFTLLINVKMPTIVGILTFTSMINTTSGRLEARNFLICQYFSFYEQLKFRAQ